MEKGGGEGRGLAFAPLPHPGGWCRMRGLDADTCPLSMPYKRSLGDQSWTRRWDGLREYSLSVNQGRILPIALSLLTAVKALAHLPK